MKNVFLIFSVLALTACASQKLANPAKALGGTPQESTLEVTSEIDMTYSDPNNILLQVNFQNKSGNWVRIDSAEFDMTNAENLPYNIIVGKDLETWFLAKYEEQKIKAHNENAGVLGAILAGAAIGVVGASNNNKAVTAAGVGTILGAAAYKDVKTIQRSIRGAQGIVQVPDTHLYAPFTVPSNSFVKRWILLNVPTGRFMPEAKLNLKTVEGETYTYAVKVLKAR